MNEAESLYQEEHGANASQRKILEMLQASETRYRNFFNLPLVGTAITSRTKGWVEVNDRTCEILGYQREELFQKTWADITHPDDLAADEAQFERMLRREIDGYELEKRFIQKDGTVVYTLLAGGCGPIGDQSPDTFYVNLLDITDRKIAQENLARNETQLRQILDGMPVPVATGNYDAQPKFTLLNKEFTKSFGYTMEDLPTVQRWMELAYPEEAYRQKVTTDWQAGMERALQDPSMVSTNYEVKVRCKDGTDRDVIFNAALTSDGPVVTLVDITDRRIAEEKLRQSEERHRLLADNASDVITVIDLGGRLLYVSPSVEKLIGYTQEEVLKLTVEDILLPEAAASARAGLEATVAAIKSGASLPGLHEEFPLRHKNGSTSWAEATSNCMLDKDGNYVATLVVTRDISKRKQLETELAEAREREKNSEEHMRTSLEKKLKTSLNAAAVAHEINQPLSRILLRASLDLEKEKGAGKETLRSLIADAERVVETIEKMRVLLRNVETVRQPVDLAQIVRSALHQLKRPLRKAGVKATRQGLEQSSILLGDDVQLQMILTNLLLNAIEAIKDSDSPRRDISIEQQCAGDFVELVIGDSGPGWPGGSLEEMLLRSTKRDGSGIGLYVVKTALDNHCGTIAIGRSPLGGAEFRLKFPRPIANSAAEICQSSPAY
jgi:PAS domain S-box-containing protein